jgi:solute carrier family 35 protein F1/2
MSDDKKEEGVALEVGNPDTEVVNSSPSIIKKSLVKDNKYFSYLCSTEFIIVLLLGQFLSFCITSTIVSSKQLELDGAIFPTTQTLLTYIILMLVYVPIDIYKKGFKGYLNMLKTRWWQCMFLFYLT